MAEEEPSPEDRERATIVAFRPTAEQMRFMRYDDETGAVEIPLSMLRDMAAWLRRYDLRPRKRGP